MFTLLQNSFNTSKKLFSFIHFIQPNNKLSPKTYKAFYDLKAILEGTSTGTLNPYMYWGKKDYFDQLVTQNKDYYLYNDEITLINSNTNNIQKYLHDCNTIVDLGPGSDASFIKKNVPFIQSIKNLSKYYSVDISKKYANSAAKLAKQFNKNLTSKAIVGDMENLDLPKCFHTQHQQHNKKLFLFTGSTLSSLSDGRIHSFLKKITSYMSDGDYLSITCDVNSNASSLLKAYNTPLNQSLAVNSLKHINYLLNTNIDFSKIKVTCEWSKNDRTIRHYLISSTPQTLKIQNHKLKIEGKKKYYIVQSRKFEHNALQEMFKVHNLNIATSFFSKEKRVIIYVLKLSKKNTH